MCVCVCVCVRVCACVLAGGQPNRGGDSDRGKQARGAATHTHTHTHTHERAERLREARYELNDEELRPYFSLPAVLDGLFKLVKRLFDVDVLPADGEAPVWCAVAPLLGWGGVGAGC